MSLTSDLRELQKQIQAFAKGYGLDFFETVFELVDADQINSLAALGGFPVRYPHWRFGMDYDQFAKGYTWGLQKIYEMVINTDPSYAYLMKSNSFTDQKIVMAHVFGHVDFFKNNYWFSKTNRKMLDQMANHAVKIRGYMDRYGQDVVEDFIDACLTIENLIDPQLPFQTPKSRAQDSFSGGPDAQAQEVGRFKAKPYMESFINPQEFLDSQKKKMQEERQKATRNPAEPERDVILFLLNNAPLETWQHEVLSIIRDEAYYYLPQRQTKIMNEGWASYWHSRIMTEKAATAAEIVDFACSHAGTMAMSPGRLNPYKIGIELFRDIEDRWNTGRFGKEWEECDDIVAKARWDKKLGRGREKIFEVRRVCNDVTFMDDYLTPEFVDRYKLYTYEFNRRTNQYEIAERDFKKVKEKLLSMLTNAGQPFIYVKDGNYQNKGELLLWHKHQGTDLDVKWARETLQNLAQIWRRPVCLETLVENQPKVMSFSGGEFSEK